MPLASEAAALLIKFQKHPKNFQQERNTRKEAKLEKQKQKQKQLENQRKELDKQRAKTNKNKEPKKKISANVFFNFIFSTRPPSYESSEELYKNSSPPLPHYTMTSEASTDYGYFDIHGKFVKNTKKTKS